MKAKVIQFEVADWAIQSAHLILERVATVLKAQSRCSLMLTGGRSARQLYLAMADLPSFRRLTGVQFYFGDERCVAPEDIESNYGMVMQTLFRNGIPQGCMICRMESDDTDRAACARRYDEALPDHVDILLLGVGEDGHIASLFPGKPSLREERRRVMHVICPKAPYERITITPLVIAHARYVFVLACGKAKAEILDELQRRPVDANTVPARLVLNATWLLDTALS